MSLAEITITELRNISGDTSPAFKILAKSKEGILTSFTCQKSTDAFREREYPALVHGKIKLFLLKFLFQNSDLKLTVSGNKKALNYYIQSK
jgi:hypothetical protein